MTNWKALSLSLPLLLGACNPGDGKAPPHQRPADANKSDASKAPADDPANKDAPPAAAPAGNPLAMLGPLGAMMASKLEEPGPYDAPIKSASFDKDAPHFLTYTLHGAIDDLSPMNLLGGGGGVTELRALTERLRKAAADKNVRGLILRVDDPSLDMASAEDLRAALLAFADGEAAPDEAAVTVLAVPPPGRSTDPGDYPPWLRPVDEPGLLRAFWVLAAQAEVVVSFNGRNFDVPFLLNRSLLHGVPARVDLLGNPYNLRPHLDLYRLLQPGRALGPAGLDVLCWALGLESPKGTLDGSQVALEAQGA